MLGLDRAATPALVDGIEQLGRLGAVRAAPLPIWLKPVRRRLTAYVERRPPEFKGR